MTKEMRIKISGGRGRGELVGKKLQVAGWLPAGKTDATAVCNYSPSKKNTRVQKNWRKICRKESEKKARQRGRRFSEFMSE